VESTSGYVKTNYPKKYTGSAKVLVIATDDGSLKMGNGKIFNTGNHPVEMLCPMLHLRDAGFKFDIATLSGKAAVLEMWAWPNKDKDVPEIYKQVKPDLDAPKKLEDITSLDGYAAVFLPGGHGALCSLPESKACGDILHMAHKKGLPTITICHGPGALLSTSVGGQPFAYDGYEAVTFSDKSDISAPGFGYTPGPMPFLMQEALIKKGMKIANNSEKSATKVDRELITGDGPGAANNLGKLCAPIVLDYALKNLS